MSKNVGKYLTSKCAASSNCKALYNSELVGSAPSEVLAQATKTILASPPLFPSRSHSSSVTLFPFTNTWCRA
jgi:hypothetical protein